MGAPVKRFWHLESFAGGLDRRDGVFTKNQNRSYDLVNYRVQNNKKLKRRPPCSRNATAFANCQGLIEWRGALYTVAKKGDAVTKPATVTGELRFDNPDHCTTWTLAGLLTFGGFPVALIKHTFPGAGVPHQYRLHVFDGKVHKPTYVEDPWCPVGWGPTLPLHAYRTGDLGALDSTWVPRMAVASGRLYISRPDGNQAFCKTGNPRVWNDRTPEDMAATGEWWYFFTTTTVGQQDFIISEAFANLGGTDKFAGYVLEYLDAGGTWRELTEDFSGTPSVHAHWIPQAVASRFAGGPDEIRARVHWTAGGGTVLRFRASLQPDMDTNGSITIRGTGETFNGTGAQTVFTCTSILNDQQPMVYVGSVLQIANVNYTRSAGAGGVAVITFISGAPPAGTDNVMVYLPHAVFGTESFTITYQGVEYRVGRRELDLPWAFFGRQPAATTWLLGITYDSVSQTHLHDTYWDLTTPAFVQSNTQVDGLSGVHGQARMRTRFLRWVLTTSGTPPLFTLQDHAYEESTFYLDRMTDYQVNLAGADDAGDLPTASQPGSDGGQITALAAMKDRLLVSYTGGTQLWAVSGLPESHVMLGYGAVGTGAQVYPEPRTVGQSVVQALARGLMSLNLSGSNLDNLRDINLGEPIEALGYPQQQDAAFWPQTGEYITAVVMPDGSRQFLVFDYSQEQKISAWSRWTVLDLPEVERFAMVPMGTKLYLRAGGYLYWFDDSATDFIDAHDPVDAAYESVWMPHFNHLEAPFRAKQAVAVEWVAYGDIKVALRWNPDMPTEETGELVYAGMSAGRASIPVSVWGTGLAPVMRSRDRAGHTLEEFGMWFIVRGR